MSTLVINGAVFTNADRTAERLASEFGLEIVTEANILSLASEMTGISKVTLEDAANGMKHPLNGFTREWEHAVACLRKAVAVKVGMGNCVILGPMGLLAPTWVTHVTRVLIVAEKPFRIIQGVSTHGLTEADSAHRVHTEEKRVTRWMNALMGAPAWEKSLYDVTIHTDRLDDNGTVELIRKQMAKYRGMSPGVIQKEKADFSLSADVSLALYSIGAVREVWTDQGHVAVTVDRNVFFKNHLRRKITGLAGKVKGVLAVDVRFGTKARDYRINPNRSEVENAPVILVDDEKRYVDTLSERLKLRKVESRVTYTGEDALESLDRKNAEIMVLDLRMPGIDGFEVLKRIKATKPEVEVIILSGKGSAR